MVRKANIVQKQELGGGKGCAEVHEIVPEKDLYGHGKLYVLEMYVRFFRDSAMRLRMLHPVRILHLWL